MEQEPKQHVCEVELPNCRPRVDDGEPQNPALRHEDSRVPSLERDVGKGHSAGGQRRTLVSFREPEDLAGSGLLISEGPNGDSLEGPV